MPRIVLDKLAFIISAVSSPYLVPFFFLIAIVQEQTESLYEFALWTGAGIFFSIGIPTITILIRYRRGEISDFHIMYREQRAEPLAIGLISASIGTAIFYEFHAPSALIKLGLCMVLNGIAFLAVTRYWKVSMHLGTLTAAIVCVLFLFGSHLLWLFLFLPPVIWARLYRRKHTLLQILAAIALSGTITSAVFLGLSPNP